MLVVVLCLILLRTGHNVMCIKMHSTMTSRVQFVCVYGNRKRWSYWKHSQQEQRIVDYRFRSNPDLACIVTTTHSCIVSNFSTFTCCKWTFPLVISLVRFSLFISSALSRIFCRIHRPNWYVLIGYNASTTVVLQIECHQINKRSVGL